ncbi:hypothetical protein ACVIOG_007251 [Rhizobium leguminosarum]
MGLGFSHILAAEGHALRALLMQFQLPLEDIAATGMRQSQSLRGPASCRPPRQGPWSGSVNRSELGTILSPALFESFVPPEGRRGSVINAP